MGPVNGTPKKPSSKFNLTLEMALLVLWPLPASDMSITFWPAGLTRRMSRSEGNVWERLESVAVTLVMAPAKPATAMVEGYWLAVLPVGMVIELPFPNAVATTFEPLLVRINWSASIKPELRTFVPRW